MWNASGPEYSRVIDPQLKWKISSNVKPRALRRARTFAQDNKKKFIVKNVKDSEDLFDKDLKKKGDMLVSESEKLVVSILGWRFSDNLEIVPTKKRRFSLPSSASPPNLSPTSDFFDQSHESHLSLFLNNKESVKQDEPSIKPSCRVDWDQEGGSADEKRRFEETDEQICDSADFYGISILAAAACDSSVETLVNEEGPGVRGHPSEENSVLVKVSEPQRDMGYLISYDPELGEIKANSSVVSFATTEALSRESGKIKPVESKRENSVSSMQNFPSKMKLVPSHDDRLHWDLNSVMDAWKTQPDKVIVETATMKTNLLDNGEKSCLVSSDAYPVEGLAELASDLFTKMADGPEEGKCETDCANFNIKLDTHDKLPHLIIPSNASIGWTKNDCGPLAEDKKVNDTLHVSYHSAECNLAYIRRKRNNPLKIPNFEKHQSLSTDDIAPSVTTQSPASELKDTCGMIIHGNDEKTFLVPIDRSNSKNMTSEGCLSDEAAYNEEFRNCHARANLSKSLFFNPQGTSDHVQLPSRSALIQKYERTTADVKDTDCIPSVDDAFNSHGACSAPANSQMRSPEKISLEEHYNSEYHSNASPIETELASGMEKVEFLRDDDSQYEYGDLIESVCNSWGEDGNEEIELLKYGSDFGSQYGSEEAKFLKTEHVDYSAVNCNYNDTSLFPSVSGEFARTGASSVRREYNDASGWDKLPRGEYDADWNYNGASRVEKSISSEGPCRKKVFYARDENRLLASAISADVGDILGRSSQLARSRMKSSGWDKLPRDEYAAVNWNYNDASLAPSVSGESARTVSSVRRDYNDASVWGKLPRGEYAAVNWNYNDTSRVERSTSSEVSCRREVFYARENRKHDHLDLNAQRNIEASRSLGRSRLSFSSHGRGRDVSWGQKEIEEETQSESESRPEGGAAEEVQNVARMTELVVEGASTRRSRRPFYRAIGRTEFEITNQDEEENVGSAVQITNQVEEYIPQPIPTIPQPEMNEGLSKSEEELREEIKQALKRPFDGALGRTEFVLDDHDEEENVGSAVQITNQVEECIPQSVVTIPKPEMNEGLRKKEQELREEIKQALKRPFDGALGRPYEGGEGIIVPLPEEMEGEVIVKSVELTEATVAATKATAPIASIGESLTCTLVEEVVPTVSFEVNIPTITSESSETLVDHLTAADLRMQIRRDIMDELTGGWLLEAYRKKQDEIAERSRLMCDSMIEMCSILRSLEARLDVLESTVSVYNEDLVDVKEDMCHWMRDFSMQNENHYLMQEDIKKLLVDSEWCTNGVFKLSNEVDTYKHQHDIVHSSISARLGSLEELRRMDKIARGIEDNVEANRLRMEGYQMCAMDMVRRGCFPRYLINDSTFMDMIKDRDGLILSLCPSAGHPRKSWDSSKGDQIEP